MLTIYTDAGMRGDHACIAYLIISESKFLAFESELISVSSSTEGELFAMCAALDYVVSKFQNTNGVTLYSDTLSLIERLQNPAKGPPNIGGRTFSLWTHLWRLCDIIGDVRFGHIYAHQSEHNPNKACDQLCSARIREAQTCTQS